MALPLIRRLQVKLLQKSHQTPLLFALHRPTPLVAPLVSAIKPCREKNNEHFTFSNLIHTHHSLTVSSRATHATLYPKSARSATRHCERVQHQKH